MTTLNLICLGVGILLGLVIAGTVSIVQGIRYRRQIRASLRGSLLFRAP